MKKPIYNKLARTNYRDSLLTNKNLNNTRNNIKCLLVFLSMLTAQFECYCELNKQQVLWANNTTDKT